MASYSSCAAAALRAADVVVLHAVGAVVLRLEPEGAGLELHVEVLGDEDRAVPPGYPRDRRRWRGCGCRCDSRSGKSVGRPSRQRGDSSMSCQSLPDVLDRRIDEDVELSAILELHALSHLLRGAEALAQPPVHLAGIRAARGGFGFETVQLLEHLDRNPDDVFLKLEHRLRVVDEDVGIEDEVFAGRDVGFFDGHGFGVFRRVCFTT